MVMYPQSIATQYLVMINIMYTLYSTHNITYCVITNCLSYKLVTCIVIDRPQLFKNSCSPNIVLGHRQVLYNYIISDFMMML